MTNLGNSDAIKQKSFGARLSELRKQRGYSVKEMSRALKVPLSTYRGWEYGTQIKGEPYVELATVLRIPLSQLLGIETSEKKETKIEELNKKIDLIEDALRQLRTELRFLVF